MASSSSQMSSPKATSHSTAPCSQVHDYPPQTAPSSQSPPPASLSIPTSSMSHSFVSHPYTTSDTTSYSGAASSIDESRKDTFKREEDETRKSNVNVMDKGKGKMQEVDNSSEIEEENQGEREGKGEEERRLNGLLWIRAMITPSHPSSTFFTGIPHTLEQMPYQRLRLHSVSNSRPGAGAYQQQQATGQGHGMIRHSEWAASEASLTAPFTTASRKLPKNFY